jgi:hypothetical protein
MVAELGVGSVRSAIDDGEEHLPVRLDQVVDDAGLREP